MNMICNGWVFTLCLKHQRYDKILPWDSVCASDAWFGMSRILLIFVLWQTSRLIVFWTKTYHISMACFLYLARSLVFIIVNYSHLLEQSTMLSMIPIHVMLGLRRVHGLRRDGAWDSAFLTRRLWVPAASSAWNPISQLRCSALRWQYTKLYGGNRP